MIYCKAWHGVELQLIIDNHIFDNIFLIIPNFLLTLIILIVLIAIQQRGTALGSAFGGGGEFYSARRGLQKRIFYATIGASALFIILSIALILFQ